MSWWLEPAPAALPQMTMTAGQPVLHVVFIGRLNYQKRPIVVVDALRRIALWAAENGVALRATLMGEGPFLGAVKDLLARYDFVLCHSEHIYSHR